MDEHSVFKHVQDSWGEIGVECKKFVGALSVEVIRQELAKNGIPVSARDVFIRGIPIEFDLIVPRHGAHCLNEILYEPVDVIAVLEIKTSGLFDYNAKIRLEECRNKVLEANSDIFFGYVTLTERHNFHKKVFGELDPEWVFTLSWFKREKCEDHYDVLAQSWQKLLSTIHALIEQYDKLSLNP